MDGAIAAVAEFGLEGTTTRRIVASGKINEGYIYRYYEDRDDLLKKTFLKIDLSFKEIVASNMPLFCDTNVPKRDRFRKLFDDFVAYFREHQKESLFYLRYYESSFNEGEVWAEHKKIFDEFAPAIRNGIADKEYAFLVPHHLFRNIILIGQFMVKNAAKDSNWCDPMFELLFTIFDKYFL